MTPHPYGQYGWPSGRFSSPGPYNPEAADWQPNWATAQTIGAYKFGQGASIATTPLQARADPSMSQDLHPPFAGYGALSPFVKRGLSLVIMLGLLFAVWPMWVKGGKKKSRRGRRR